MSKKMCIRSVVVVLVLAWSATAQPQQLQPAKVIEAAPASPASQEQVSPTLEPSPPKPANLVRTKADSAEPPVAEPKNVIWIANPHFRVKHEIKGTGPSGIRGVGLWLTRDAKEWTQDSFASPNDGLTVRVKEDGLYGIRLKVYKGDGRFEPEPKSGDQPQIWVHVDSMPPYVVIYPCEIGDGASTGKITLRWSADDRNFTEKPISLYYAKEVAGPWKPIAENIPNQGRWMWDVPPDILPRIYLRCKAVDKAGNVTEATTPEPVIIDFAKPEAVILGIEPIVDKPK